MTYYKPLTPDLRLKIDASIDSQIAELQTCKMNTLVNMQISALATTKRMIHGLPDGYPMPMEEERETR